MAAATHEQAPPQAPNSGLLLSQEVQILAEVGCDPAVLHLQADPSSNKAPVELLGEFLRCIMNAEYRAAKILCNRVLELESDNVLVKEFITTIDERIQLDKELDTESDTESSTDDSSTSDDDDDNDSDETSSDSSDSSGDDDNDAYQHDNSPEDTHPQPQPPPVHKCNHSN